MSERSSNTNQIPMSESDVREGIIKNLKEWGFDPTYNEEHKAFWDEAVEEAVENSKPDSGAPISINHIFANDGVLSKDITEAVRQVLRNELESSNDEIFFDTNDSIEFNSYKPFYHRFDRRTGKTILCQQNAAKKYTPNQLDPLKRFDVTAYNAEDWYRKSWKFPPSVGGHVYEALVARHMIDQMQCRSCGCRHQLYWNGGFDSSSSWADVVCKNCMASYEIKSVSSDATFEKKLKYNSFNGGSFRKFHKNPARYQARYFVIVSREATSSQESNDCTSHRVSIAEIQKVEPSLRVQSFDVAKASRIRIQSNVKINKNSLEKAWCYVPTFKTSHTEIAQSVFEDYYGSNFN